MLIYNRYLLASLKALMLCSLFMSAHVIADDVAPSEPGSLSSVRYSSTAGEIIWAAASDNLAVVGYQVTRDGETLGVLDARSLYEPALIPNRAYTYLIRAVDRQGNEGAPLQVQMSAAIGETSQGMSPGGADVGANTGGNTGGSVDGGADGSGTDAGGSDSGGTDGGADDGGSTDDGTSDGGKADVGGIDDGDLILYSNKRRLTLLEGDSSGASITLSVNRLRGEKRPVTLSLVGDSARETTELSHQFSSVVLNPNESGSVLMLRLDVGVAPLIFHERRFNIVADDGVSSTSTELVIDVTPTSAPDVYLLIGQSNMEGYSEVGSKEQFPGGQDERVERIQQLNVQPNSNSIFTSDASFTNEGVNVFTPQFVIAEDPLHEPRYISVDGKGATFAGLGLTFAKQALTLSTATTYLVPSAWGATGFCANANGNLAWNAEPTSEEFLGGTLLADRAMTRLNMTLRDTGGILRGILWHQGGADSNNPDCARTYADNLAKLVKRLRRDARKDQRGSQARGDDALIPFIVATQSRGDDSRANFSTFNPSKQLVDAVHRTVENVVPFSDFVNNDDLVPPQHPCGQVSCVHFGASALREQGRRFYAAIKRVWSASGAYHY